MFKKLFVVVVVVTALLAVVLSVPTGAANAQAGDVVTSIVSMAVTSTVPLTVTVTPEPVKSEVAPDKDVLMIELLSRLIQMLDKLTTRLDAVPVAAEAMPMTAVTTPEVVTDEVPAEVVSSTVVGWAYPQLYTVTMKPMAAMRLQAVEKAVKVGKDGGLSLEEPKFAGEPFEFTLPSGQVLSKWVSPFVYTPDEFARYLTSQTQFQVPNAVSVTMSFEYGTWQWQHATLGPVTHDPVLNARHIGQGIDLPFLTINSVPGAWMDVVYDNGSTCEMVNVAEIVANVRMTVTLTNPGMTDATFAAFNVGPGGRVYDANGRFDPHIGNDAKVPDCNPRGE